MSLSVKICPNISELKQLENKVGSIGYSEVENILNRKSVNQLIRTIEEFSGILSFYNIFVRVYTVQSIIDLNEFSDERIDKITSQYQLMNSWFSPNMSEPEPNKIDVNKEVKFLKKALNHFGLQASDDFFATVSDDQVLEIYGADMIQLYRNINFFKFCGYSLLEISIYEWFNLWDRPKSVLDMIFNQVNCVMKNVVPVMDYTIPFHVLREKKSTSGLTDGYIPKASLVRFKQIGTVVEKNRPQIPAGLICSANAELIASGEEALQIEFV